MTGVAGNKIIFNNLQLKVTFLFLLASLVPLGLVSVFSVRHAEDQIVELAFNQINNVAEDKLSLLERWLRERRADILVVAASPSLRSMDHDSIVSYLKAVGDNYEVYRVFVVVARDGEIVYASEGASREIGKEPWFRETMAGRFYISPVYLEAGRQESFFKIAAPVLGAEGEVLGAVCATVGTQAILSMVLKVSLGRTGESYLVDGGGAFLAHQDARKILRENIAQSESFRNIFYGSRNRRIYTDYRGIEVLGASRHIPGTDWYLVVEQDRDEAFAGVAGLKRYIYTATVCSVIGVLILAWLFAYYIAAPVKRLSEAADALKRGEFKQARISTGRGDEIGALYAAFSDMARQLEARQEILVRQVDLRETELKQADVKLKMTEQAAARSQRLAALGRLAAGVTHEIRTPLASIKLFLQAMKDEIEISEECAEDYRIAMQQVLRIEATINRFLDFAKPQEPVFGVIEVAELIEEALLMAHPRANHQEVLIRKRVAAGLPSIRGDRKQLSEVLLNLMVNALDVTSKGDTLGVSAGLVKHNINGVPRPCLRIDVSDTGPGIAPENLEKMFDPFFTTKASGTGLGLSIVHSTVIRHGGEVSVKSSAGQGSVFSVFLPLPREGEREDESPPDS
ncbi:MAG TPA: cache domain-containing protein [bacterium]|nr:cache domain-containing protein [bacterium]